MQAATASRVESVMAAEAAADNALNVAATEAEAYVTTKAVASTALTLEQATAAASRVESVMAHHLMRRKSLVYNPKVE